MAAADSMTDLERLVARDEIRQLACRYAFALDSRDLDTLVSLFVPEVKVGRYGDGPAALRESFLDSLSEIGVSILFVGNHLIDVEGPNRASGVVYCHGWIEDAVKQRPRWIEQAIQYRDTYERRDGAWRFVQRRHMLWYGVELPESPLSQEPANWPKNQVGRGTVPQDLPSWDAFWTEVAERGS